MAHQFESGMFTSKPAWHNLGVVVQDAPTTLDAIHLAGLDWQVKKTDVITIVDSTYQSISEDYKCITRTSDGKILGVATDKYQPLQNSEAFKFFDAFIDAGHASIESAGSLFGGRKVWILCKVKSDNLVLNANDEIAKYILLSNSHDGKSSANVGFTPVRVVCANTLAQAMNSKESALKTVRHSKLMTFKLDEIKATMNLVNQSFDKQLEQYKAIEQKSINNQAQLMEYFKTCMELGENAMLTSDCIGGKKGSKVLDKLNELYQSGRGVDVTGNNYWRAYNAVNEYLNHFRGDDETNRLESLWYGDSSRRNDKALLLAVAA